jgi:hypothetical protein
MGWKGFVAQPLAAGLAADSTQLDARVELFLFLAGLALARANLAPLAFGGVLVK